VSTVATTVVADCPLAGQRLFGKFAVSHRLTQAFYEVCLECDAVTLKAVSQVVGVMVHFIFPFGLGFLG
jgi:hypothetical protein